MGAFEDNQNGSRNDNFVDTNVLAKLLGLKKVLSVKNHGSSAWATTFRIEVQLSDSLEESYFLKVSTGLHGRESLKGEFESTSAIRAIVPNFVPRPIAWGTYKSLPDTHFYLAEFRDLVEELPEPPVFCEQLAEFHSNSKSPNGKYGFHVVTYNGNLPQENGWTDTWEECFLNGMKHMIKLNFEAGGPSKELEDLMPAMYQKVIPRLLRPLETGGNTIKPSLVHGDLWCGNAAVDGNDNLPLVFDPSSFYAHNEYEMGNWRHERNKFSRSYFTAYHSHIPKATPEEDYDDRNALYGIRFNVHAATLFPTVLSFRQSVITEMQRLVAKYPGGYEDWVK